jgi:hypothetical protein
MRRLERPRATENYEIVQIEKDGKSDNLCFSLCFVFTTSCLVQSSTRRIESFQEFINPGLSLLLRLMGHQQ